MSNVKDSDLTGHAGAYRERVVQLEDEIDHLREASFNSLRDLQASHQEQKQHLTEKHKKDLEELSERYEDKIQEEKHKIQFRDKRAQKDEIRSALGQAQRKWVEEEEKRFREFKIELVHAKNNELAEQEAYWRAELSRISRLSESDTQKKRRSGSSKKRKRNSERKPERTLLAFCALVLVISAGVVLYLLSSQGNATVKPIVHRILAEQDASVRDSVYKYAPWLKSYAEQAKSVTEPAAVVRTEANLREGPNLESGVIRVLDSGVHVHVLEVRDTWS